MTKEEAIVRLCDTARNADDPELLRAVCIAAKCLARAGIHKRRNKASRAARDRIDRRLAEEKKGKPNE